jgi:hypothetical protein
MNNSPVSMKNLHPFFIGHKNSFINGFLIAFRNFGGFPFSRAIHYPHYADFISGTGPANEVDEINWVFQEFVVCFYGSIGIAGGLLKNSFAGSGLRVGELNYSFVIIHCKRLCREFKE